MAILVSTAGFVVAEREGQSEQYAGAHLESVFPLYVRLSAYVYSGVVRDITRYVWICGVVDIAIYKPKILSYHALMSV